MVGKKILIVDDETDFADSLADILREQGCVPSAVYDPYEALRAVEDDDFDMLLLDIKMPGMNGVELFKKIKGIKRIVPVIMMTAYAVEELLTEARIEGVTKIVNKPLDIPYLMSLIDEA